MPPNKHGKIGGLLDLAEPQQRERPHPMRPEHHRIKRAETSCDVSCVYRASGIAGLSTAQMQESSERTHSWDLNEWID